MSNNIRGLCKTGILINPVCFRGEEVQNHNVLAIREEFKITKMKNLNEITGLQNHLLVSL